MDAESKPLKLFVDQQVIPAAIDLAGRIEVAAARIAAAARVRPLRAVLMALGAGCLLAALAARPRRPN